MTHESYERWLEECREVLPPVNLADQIMRQITNVENQRRDTPWLRLTQRVERSRLARWMVYCGALAIGSLPFVFLAHVSQL